MQKTPSSLTTMSRSLALAMPTQAAECGGVRMPDSLIVHGVTLPLNGPGLREVTVFNVDVYVAAPSTEHRSANGAEIAQSTEGTVRSVIEGDDFARFFFNIWLGPISPNSGLKRGLLGSHCG